MILIYVQGLIAMSVLASLTWLVSLRKHDASIVDSIWSLLFLVGMITYALPNVTWTLQHKILFTLVILWSLRLSVYITWRNHGKPEDSRYREIRNKYSPGFAFKSLLIIFLFQAFLAWIISLPLWFVFTHDTQFGFLDAVGISLWIIGMFFEVVGDAQLARFKSSTANQKGKVMDRGLWRYTRHPNYFGEACLWWGYFLFAASAGGWWTILSPILMTWLLLKFSGVVLLEKDIVNRRPAYQEYISRTSAFLPWFPKRPRETSGQGEVSS